MPGSASRAPRRCADARAGRRGHRQDAGEDICAYLRLIANDGDDPAFLRAVTTPRRGLGQTTLAQIAAARQQSLFAAVFAAGETIPARPREAPKAMLG